MSGAVIFHDSFSMTRVARNDGPLDEEDLIQIRDQLVKRSEDYGLAAVRIDQLREKIPEGWIESKAAARVDGGVMEITLEAFDPGPNQP